ncbi:MAG: 5-formyltetrahydrofolate cyclo-ligase [Candidatus Omnitrophica bacterium]|nr:5-formyltetrahydrofolate cyclo-ligase [Candidatus Omnitrophota bacterium]
MIQSAKEQIRRQMMERLRRQPSPSRQQKSQAILSRITALPEYLEVKWFFSYISMEHEVETIRLMEEGLAAGKRIVVPVILEEGKKSCSFSISEIRDCLKEFEIGPFGIRQPKPQFLQLVDPEVLEMAVIPGVAFGRDGHRLGHGKGYFDRFLRQLSPDCLKVGIGFDFQLLPELPNEPHDIPLDVIITDLEVLQIKHR